ncbi:3'5'-cyclic nucleotide phosphodiesterase domain-containing protein [Besnoitia besnoiti]|uniref:Phosphodiesterase n=1 Tax=Besnoitia besnoiti TaxID=94643 RepID=A0A2A9MJ42_BESBE|nr:3'5'-cyclic nucleotide phosphodiesterase domain-containing protein [Besnoitia besnoiti]PFH36271.1 3'5'-cyclic nucleotide phosphodiesterase domain-containing protein [Besnoitia besnoiti]
MAEHRSSGGKLEAPANAAATLSPHTESLSRNIKGSSSFRGRTGAASMESTSPNLAPGVSKGASAAPADGLSGEAPTQLKSILINRQARNPADGKDEQGTRLLKLPAEGDDDAITGQSLASGPMPSQFVRKRRGIRECWDRLINFMMPLWENEVNFVLKEEAERQAFTENGLRPIRSKTAPFATKCEPMPRHDRLLKNKSYLANTMKMQETAGTTVKSVGSVASAASSLTSTLQVKRRPLRTSMSFCGLRFRDKRMEEEFVFNNNRLFKYRNAFAGFLCFISCLANYIILSLSTTTGVILYGSVPAVVGFHVLVNSSFVVIVWFMFVYRMPFFRNYQEQTSYLVALSAYGVVFVYAVLAKIDLYWGDVWQHIGQDFLPNTLLFYKNPEYPHVNDTNDPRFVIYILLNEFMLSAVCDSYYFVITHIFDSILPSRSRYVLVYQTILISMSYLVTLLGACRYPLLLYPAFIRLNAMLTCYVVGLAGEFMAEVQRRGLFFEWYMMRKKLNEVQREKKKAKRKHATSALDDLRATITEIRNVLLQAKIRCKEYDVSAEINQVLELVEDALKVLANSWNLYSVQVDESLQQEGFIKAMDVEPRVKRICLVSGPQGSTRTIVKSLRETAASCSRSMEVPLAVSIDEVKPTMDLLPVVGVDFSYDILRFSKACPDSVLLEVGYAMLSRPVADWGCDDTVLREFLHTVESLYRDNPYHSAIHGAMVAHSVGCLLRGLGVYREMNSVATTSCAVAALCHDIGHPGRNNNFFVASGAPLAVLYNDKAVLENFHSALAFRILGRPECNVFAYLTDAEFKDVRANMIDLILATDMKTHFDFLSRFRNRRQAPGFNFHKVPEDQWLVAEICIRASDLGHAMVEWDQHFEWASRVVTEFYLQGDQERRMGLHISPLCDREDHSSFAKCQQGFLGYVVKPLLLELAECDLSQRITPQLTTNIDRNMKRWEAFTNQEITVVLSAAAMKYDMKYQEVDASVDVSLLTAKDISGLDKSEDDNSQGPNGHHKSLDNLKSSESDGGPRRGASSSSATDDDDRTLKLQQQLLQQQQDFEIQQQNLMKQIIERQEQNAALEEQLERHRCELARQQSEMRRQEKAIERFKMEEMKAQPFNESSFLKRLSGSRRKTIIGAITANGLFGDADDGELDSEDGF